MISLLSKFIVHGPVAPGAVGKLTEAQQLL